MPQQHLPWNLMLPMRRSRGITEVPHDDAGCHAGVPFACKELGPGGPGRGVPLTRPLMTIARVYVNPATGVGPDPSALAPFNTLLLTPMRNATGLAPVRPGGVELSGALGTAAAVLPTARLTGGNPRRASGVAAVAAGVDTNGSRSLIDSPMQAEHLPGIQPIEVPSVKGRAARLGAQSDPILRGARLSPELLQLAARHPPAACPKEPSDGGAVASPSPAADDPCVRSLVGLSQCTPQGSPDVCCGFVEGWSTAGCWCETSGRALLDSMPTSATPTLLQLLGWVCE